MSAFEPISKIANGLYRKSYPHRSDDLSYPAAKVTPTHPRTWSANKQLALLTVGRLLPFASDCIAHMRVHGARFDQPHLAELRINGLIYKQDILARFHKLTPTGKRYVEDTAIIVATQLGLHHIRDSSRTTDRNNLVFTKSCTCGWRASSGVFTRSNLSIDDQVKAHLADPDEWKRRRSEPTPAVAAAFARIEKQFAPADAIDDATNVYGDGDAEWPDDACDASPSGNHTFNCQTDPAVCIHCKRKT